MKVNIKTIISGIVIVAALAVFSPAPHAMAQPTSQGNACDTSFTIFPRWYDNGLCKNGNIISPAEMTGADTGEKFGKWAAKLAMNIVSIILYAVGYVSLGFIIYGGFKYMISGDSSSGIQGAQKTIQNAVIGLVISILSVAVVTFITGAIG